MKCAMLVLAAAIAVIVSERPVSAGHPECYLPAEGDQLAIDLNRLAKKGDYNVQSVTGGDSFELNICKDTKYKIDNTCPAGTMNCKLVNGAPMTAFAYTANIQTTRVNNGAQLIARGGICTAPEGGNVRTIINFECNSAGQQQSLVNTAATDCEATFDFITHVACGGSASAKVTVSVNIGMILLLAFFIPLIVYFVVGTGILYHRGNRGADMVPNLTFWTLLPGLVKDGVMFSVAKVRGTDATYEKI